MPLRAPISLPKDIREFTRWTRQALTGLVSSDEITDQAVTTSKIADSAVTNAKFRDSAACSVVGRPTNTSGPITDIVAADGQFLVRRAGVVEFDVLADGDIPASIARDSEVSTAISTAISALNLASGTYTPTLTNVTNLDGSTAHKCQYLRVGNTVTVSGKVDADATAAGSTQLGISLPIASNLGAQEDCAGSAFSNSVAGQGAAILGDATNDRAQMEWIAVDVSNRSMYFSFSYQVI